MKILPVAVLSLVSAIAATGAWITGWGTRAQVNTILTQSPSTPRQEEVSSDSLSSHEPLLEPHTLVDAEALVSEVGTTGSAADLATLLVDLDSWFFDSDVEDRVDEIKSAVSSKLRNAVESEVTHLHQAALASSSFGAGAELLAEAGNILALFPMSDNESIMARATNLSTRHTMVRIRMQLLQRQRYNSWAVERIEAALLGYDHNKSFLSPKDENPKLMESLTAELGAIDPAILEPIVLDLYGYVIEKTKDSISEKDKVELAKMLTDPSIRRRTLGDF